MTSQTHAAILLLQQFLLRALSERKPSRVWWEAMRGIRQKQADQEFAEMELAHGTVREPGKIDWRKLPF